MIPAERWGPWPELPPFSPDTVAAVWLDGSLASAVAAGWLARGPNPWRAIAVHVEGRPRRSQEAARELARALGQAAVPLTVPGGPTEPAGWALAHRAAVEAGADWLVFGLGDAPGASLRLFAAEEALRAAGFGGIWAPLAGEDAISLARLAIALDLPLASTWDCRAESACGICPGCLDRKRAFRQLGMPDPALGVT